MGCNTPNTAEAIGPIAWEFSGRNLGLSRCPNPNSDHLTATINIGTDRLSNFRTDSGETLGELGCGDAINGQPIVVDALNFFNLAGFESLWTTVDSFDTRTMPNATASILDENRRTLPVEVSSLINPKAIHDIHHPQHLNFYPIISLIP